MPLEGLVLVLINWVQLKGFNRLFLTRLIINQTEEREGATSVKREMYFNTVNAELTNKNKNKLCFFKKI